MKRPFRQNLFSYLLMSNRKGTDGDSQGFCCKAQRNLTIFNLNLLPYSELKHFGLGKSSLMKQQINRRLLSCMIVAYEIKKKLILRSMQKTCQLP